jgi:hypothetical protein
MGMHSFPLITRYMRFNAQILLLPPHRRLVKDAAWKIPRITLWTAKSAISGTIGFSGLEGSTPLISLILITSA